MKQLFILLLAASALMGCKDKNKGKLDPDAMVSLRPEIGVKADNPNHLSALEIVKQTESVRFYNYALKPDGPVGRGFHDKQRDTVNLRLMMWGSDVIGSWGELMTEFIDGEDVVFVRFDRPTDKIIDTVAYIPNRVLREAAAQIRTAYADEDYARCYAIFDEVYRFIPINGAEWRELKAQGKN